MTTSKTSPAYSDSPFKFCHKGCGVTLGFGQLGFTYRGFLFQCQDLGTDCCDHHSLQGGQLLGCLPTTEPRQISQSTGQRFTGQRLTESAQNFLKHGCGLKRYPGIGWFKTQPLLKELNCVILFYSDMARTWNGWGWWQSPGCKCWWSWFKGQRRWGAKWEAPV